jgi:hypothetical protein
LFIVAARRNHAPDIHADIDLVDQLHNPLDSNTSRDSEWCFLARNVEEIWDILELDIAALNKRCKQTYHRCGVPAFEIAVLKRKEQLNTGRMRMALASLLEKRKQSFLYDTLLYGDGSYDADRVVQAPYQHRTRSP